MKRARVASRKPNPWAGAYVDEETGQYVLPARARTPEPPRAQRYVPPPQSFSDFVRETQDAARVRSRMLAQRGRTAAFWAVVAFVASWFVGGGLMWLVSVGLGAWALWSWERAWVEARIASAGD